MRTPGRRRCGFSPAIAALLLTVPACLSTADCKPARPNILFIAVDDLRCELGCYGVKEIKSPNLDRLAASGVAFTRAYCQQAVCNPSRASLMTGLRPDSTKVWDLDTDLRSTIPEAVTIPQHFRQHGYRAVAFGKIFHSTFPDDVSWDEPTHQAQGVELWPAADRTRLADLKKQMKADGRNPAAIKRMRGPATVIQNLPDDRNFDGKQTTDALAKMRELSETGSPFFLAVGYFRPHLPFVSPKKYWEIYDRATIPLATNGFLPRGAPAVAFGDRSLGGFYELRDYMNYADAPSPFERPLTGAQQRELKHGYYAAVSFIDAQVGRLLDGLDRLGLAQNTIVVLWGDHGWKLGEHGGWCKQTNYEIDTRAPLMIRAPGAKENGKPSAALVEFVDIYPTLCELSSLPLPGTLEGRSLVPLLTGSAAKVKDAAFSQFPRKHEGRDYMGYAMRSERYRYIEWLDRETGKISARELYDHDSDPSENENIAGHPEHAGLLAGLNAQMWTTLPKPPPIADAAKSQRPRLRILNGSAQPIDIFWLKSGTERMPNGSVDPGRDTIITTTPGHRFEVVGRDDRATATVTSEVPVQGFRFDPQGSDGVPSFYTQAVTANGFPIVASAKVNPYALKEAAFLVNMMLVRRPDVREAMIKSGARMCIMAHNEYTTDLPEWSHLTPRDYRDARARGMGGSETDPYCSSAEENILGYPGDPYAAECIVIHEFAHNIHLRGMVNVDPTFDQRVKSAYDAAMKAGLWRGKYASVNHHEYFAEGVQSWFDNNRVNDHDHNHVNTRALLLDYDPGLAAMCREVFGDTVIKYTKPATRLTGHMAGYDPAKAPTFVWPERLRQARAEIRAKTEARDKAVQEK